MDLSKQQQQQASLRDKALRECRYMAEHAMATGKSVPPQVMQVLEKLEMRKTAQLTNNANLESSARNYDGLGANESDADLMAQLSIAHNALAQTIGPATPESIIKMRKEAEGGGILNFLGKVGLVRKMNFLVLLCLAGFIGLFASDLVDSKSINGPILDYPLVPFLLNQSFLLSMATLGACFYNLFEAYKYITDGTYDSKYENVYWIRFTLGIVSGIMLSQFIIVNPEEVSSAYVFTKPLLAFLGGFSARVVYRILTRLVEALEAFIDGSAKDVLDARQQVANVKLQQNLDKLKRDYADKLTVDRLAAATELIKLKDRLTKGEATHDEMKIMVDKLLNDNMIPVSPTVTQNPVTFPDFNLTPSVTPTVLPPNNVPVVKPPVVEPLPFFPPIEEPVLPNIEDIMPIEQAPFNPPPIDNNKNSGVDLPEFPDFNPK